MDRMNIRVWQGFFMPVVISTSNDSRRACNYVDKCILGQKKKGTKQILVFQSSAKLKRKFTEKMFARNVCTCLFFISLKFSKKGSSYFTVAATLPNSSSHSVTFYDKMREAMILTLKHNLTFTLPNKKSALFFPMKTTISYVPASLGFVQLEIYSIFI